MRDAAPSPARLEPLAARTLVDQVVERIVEGAARGAFLPGDRVVEAEIARDLNVSRVPVREALRLLESQGIVVNSPYRGMRLMEVSVARLDQILQVRLALETLAAKAARRAAAEDPGRLAPLERVVGEMRAAAERGDGYALARLDASFHRQLCALSGNDVLVRTWEPLSLQLTIIFGLCSLRKPLGPIVVEHEEIVSALRSADAETLVALMQTHICEWRRGGDQDALIARLEAAGRGGEPGG